MYINKYDKFGISASVGKSAEDLFEKYLKRAKIKYRPATKFEQYEHIDFVLAPNSDKQKTIDVKGPKKVGRGNTKTTDDLLWVEFNNVQGNKGWLYGKNDLLAFYNIKDECFYVVVTKHLAKLCEKLCDDIKVYNPQDALYHKYTRYNRKDVVSLIKFDDLFQIPYRKIKIKWEADLPNEN